MVKDLDGADIVVWLVSRQDLEADASALRTFKIALEASSADEIPPLLVPVFIGGIANDQESLEAELIARALSAALESPFVGGVKIDQIDVAPPDVLAPIGNVIADKLEQARRVSTLRRIAEAKRSGSWRNTARQAWRAAGSLTRAVTRRPRR